MASSTADQIAGPGGRSRGKPAHASRTDLRYQMEHTEPLAAVSSDVYYQSGYWNDFPEVAAEINRRISGKPDRDYLAHFLARIGERRFSRALFLNCGSGWVERDFLARGVVESAVGIDYSDDLLDRARKAARDLPIRYVQLDVNHGELPDDAFDLVVNYAAGHHIARLDRVFRALCRRMTHDAWFVSYDYVGAHRNQYSYEQWSAVWELNNALPADGRQALAYPHLPTMMHTDPSEAVHSELILETFRRYFAVQDYRPVGGALAYPLLTFNRSLLAMDEPRRRPIVSEIMDADRRFLDEHPQLTQFAYWCGRPRHDTLADHLMLDRWKREETAREEAAAAAGGRYYGRTLLESLIYPQET